MNLRLSILFILSLFFLVSCNYTAQIYKEPAAVRGGLSTRDFSEDGSINPDGEWEFSWEQFLDLTENNNHFEKIEYLMFPVHGNPVGLIDLQIYFKVKTGV